MGDSCIYQEYLGSTHLILVKLILKLHCRTCFMIHPRLHFFPRRKYDLSSASLFGFDLPSVRLLSCLLGIAALHICAVKKGAGRRCWRRRRLNVENSFLSVVGLPPPTRNRERERKFSFDVCRMNGVWAKWPNCKLGSP